MSQAWSLELTPPSSTAIAPNCVLVTPRLEKLKGHRWSGQDSRDACVPQWSQGRTNGRQKAGRADFDPPINYTDRFARRCWNRLNHVCFPSTNRGQVRELVPDDYDCGYA